MNKKNKSSVDFSNPSLNSTEIPTLDSQTANQLLYNVLDACDMEPSTIPIEVLESWENYKRIPVDFGRNIGYFFLILLILLPLAFFHPNISAKRVQIDSAADAVYTVSIHTLLPVRTVHASLNGTPIALQKNGSKEYTAVLTENGTFTVRAATWNGQETEEAYSITHLDTENPELLQSYTQNGSVYLIVRDTYSGIDYDGITGIKPESIDEETGTIVFPIPDVPVTVTIPDYAQNQLTLLISPVDRN